MVDFPHCEGSERTVFRGISSCLFQRSLIKTTANSHWNRESCWDL